MQAQSKLHSRHGKIDFFKSGMDGHSSPQIFAREGVDPLTHAFDKKITVHAGFGGCPVPESERAVVLKRLLSQPRQERSAVYVHVPFCESYCLYCGFYNRAYCRQDGVNFTDALRREIDLWAEHAAVTNGPVHAVYIGGGTPTALESTDLERLLKHIKAVFPLANDCEITVEGRIHNFSGEKMEACLAGGANRFSLGVQTFDTGLRQAMKRMADRRTILTTLAKLRDYGQAVVVIDLIYGFPDQTMELWRRDIEDYLSLELDGVDLYQLNIFAKSPLAKSIEAGKFPEAADLPQQARMFAEGVRMLEQARYRRLSVGHWGRTTRERNIYNHLMKDSSDCLAFGPGAGGCLNGHFYVAGSDYSAWLASVEAGRKPMAMMIAPSALVGLDKAIAAGIDLGRINLSRLEVEFHQPVAQALAPLLEQWQRAGLVERDGDWLELTLAGQFWHINLAQLMVGFLNQHGAGGHPR
jgi:anaerobilin synthase